MSGRRRQPVHLLNSDFIAHRRKLVGRSLASAADWLRVGHGTLRRLEAGGDQGTCDLSFVQELAQLLGVRAAQLFLDYEPAPVPAGDNVRRDDARRVGAIVAGAESWVFVDDLAKALSWTRNRTDLALEALEERLPAVGQLLAWAGDREVRLLGDADLAAAVGRVTDRAIATWGLKRDEAAKLRDVVWSGEKARHREGLVTVQRLINAGLLEATSEDASVDLRLSEQGRINLLLEDAEDWMWPMDLDQ